MHSTWQPVFAATGLQTMAEIMDHQTVFGRATPAQKKDKVRALKPRGTSVP
jgi:hypothetical protein